MNGLIGRKIGMTRVFDAEGKQVPVTVIEAGPCVVVQRKTKTRDGYESVQLGFGEQTEKRTSCALLGRFKKLNVSPRKHLGEFSLSGGDEVKAGDTVTVGIFGGISHVDIVGVTKGRGFAGVMRRHGMRGGPCSHGGHSKRRVGSIGQKTWPATVAKGKRMSGHMGHVRVTTQNVRVVEVREAENLLLVHGAVSGPNGGVVLVKKALKKGYCKGNAT